MGEPNAVMDGIGKYFTLSIKLTKYCIIMIRMIRSE